MTDLKNNTTKHIIGKFKEMFARLGISAILRCDNAKYFTSMELGEFLKQWKFNVIISSPHFA